MFFLKQIIFFLIIAIISISCSNVGKLNFQNHKYGTIPSQIVWIQIAGLGEEHLALLRFYLPQAHQITSFEQAQCLGKTWSYNFYDIRPNAHTGLLSQIVGSKNMKDSCEDFSKNPIWNYFDKSGYKTGIFELAGHKDSLEKSLQCRKPNFLKNTTLWKMSKASSKNSYSQFHYLDKTQTFTKGEIYYDRACQQGNCYSSLGDNIATIFPSIARENNKYFFLIRDFSYLEALKQKKIKKATDKLKELDNLVKYFAKLAQNNRKFLLLVSTSGTQNFELPSKGLSWKNLDKSKSLTLYKRTSLMGSTMAIGARAENFCGIYEESQIFDRINKSEILIHNN